MVETWEAGKRRVVFCLVWRYSDERNLLLNEIEDLWAFSQKKAYLSIRREGGLLARCPARQLSECSDRDSPKCPDA
jgi:hypothetical protein